MTAAPTSTNRFGERVWEWASGDGLTVVEVTADTEGGQAACLRAFFDAQGVGLTANRCREVAAVLVRLADEKEGRR